MYVLMRKRLTLFLFIHLLEKVNNLTSSNKYLSLVEYGVVLLLLLKSGVME